jgi:hypothetical protein
MAFPLKKFVILIIVAALAAGFIEDAIVESWGMTVAYVLSGNGTRATLREIAAGVSVDGETEIKSGLASGEEVAIQDQQFLTGGAAVQVIGK